jgi:type II secretory pathway component PulC
MKYLKLLFFIILIIILNSTAFALNLDVDNDLNDFAKKNLLNENLTQNLNNPFFLNEQLKEAPAEEVELQTPPNMAVNTIKTREEVEEVDTGPEFTINGVISASNSRIALLISYQQEKHLLEIGDSLDGYKFTAYQNGEATFKKEGREIKVLY